MFLMEIANGTTRAYCGAHDCAAFHEWPYLPGSRLEEAVERMTEAGWYARVGELLCPFHAPAETAERCVTAESSGG